MLILIAEDLPMKFATITINLISLIWQGINNKRDDLSFKVDHLTSHDGLNSKSLFIK